MNNGDIEVLEEYVEEFNENKKKYKMVYSTGFGKYWADFVQAIENLIKGYRKLEKKNKRYEKYLRNKDIEHEKVLEYIETEKEIDYIPKSKVREKMEQDTYTNEHTILGGRRNGKTLEYGIRLGRIQMCEELLQEGDK